MASDNSSNGSSLVKTQASFTVPAEEWKISQDHNYSMSVPMVYPTYGLDKDSLTPYTEIELDPLVENNIDNDFNDKEVYDYDFDDECKDPNWNLPKGKKILLSDGNESSEGESEGELEPSDTDKKYLVFSNCLDQLLKRCPKCGVVVTGHKKKTTGSMLSVEMICLAGQITHWDSQPITKRKPVGNLLLAASILCTGNTFASVSRLASCLNLQLISESVFYNTRQRFLFPVLNQAWKHEQETVRQELVNKGAININGDGRCDSPGHSAKYGTYTLLDDDSGKVVAFSVVQVSEVTSSNAMEKEGFKCCIESLEDDRVQIDRIATDRHVSISSFMNKEHPQINHQYDVWHLSKWVVKK